MAVRTDSKHKNSAFMDLTGLLCFGRLKLQEWFCIYIGKRKWKLSSVDIAMMWNNDLRGKRALEWGCVKGYLEHWWLKVALIWWLCTGETFVRQEHNVLHITLHCKQSLLSQFQKYKYNLPQKGSLPERKLKFYNLPTRITHLKMRTQNGLL